MPAVRIASENSAPTAETGVISAVVVGGEGKDSEKKDAQDATRTTAETQVTPDTQEAVQPPVPAILIIEDSTELAEIIEATLQRINLKTAHETHGTRALTRFNEMKPDVVLLDIGLPDMTGWKLLDHIKEVKGDAQMPAIIVITAYGDPANRLVGKLRNVHDYLIKPFTADEVERVVLSAVNGAVR
jgi:CheY-like chemotaxis protein